VPETLQFIRQLSRHVKGPIPEGAVCAADWGSFLPKVSAFPFSYLKKLKIQRKNASDGSKTDLDVLY
jgi:hypothetical protein